VERSGYRVNACRRAQQGEKRRHVHVIDPIYLKNNLDFRALRFKWRERVVKIKNTPDCSFSGRNYKVGCIQHGEVAGCPK
jgi:hypothetical protein